MEYLYLSFGGVIIKLIFPNVKDRLLSPMRRKLRGGIFKNYEGFIVKSANEGVDFYIHFIEKGRKNNIIFMKLQNRLACYMRIYEKVGKNKFEVHYTISLSQFQLILQHILAKHLNKNDGLILHSSAVKNGNIAYLFFGVSGAGKSTAAALLGEKYKVIADDAGIVKRDKEDYYFYQTPFAERTKIDKTSTKYLLGKIFIVKKAKFFKVEKIMDKNEIMDKLIGLNELNRVFNMTFEEEKVNKKYIKILLALVANFDEFYYLYFAKDSKKLMDLFSRIV